VHLEALSVIGEGVRAPASRSPLARFAIRSTCSYNHPQSPADCHLPMTYDLWPFFCLVNFPQSINSRELSIENWNRYNSVEIKFPCLWYTIIILTFIKSYQFFYSPLYYMIITYQKINILKLDQLIIRN